MLNCRKKRYLLLFEQIYFNQKIYNFQNRIKNQLMKVIVEKIYNNRICLIKINRPEVRNCVDSQTAELLYKAFSQFDLSESQIAIFYGQEYFCSGFDLGQASKQDQSKLKKWKTGFNGKGPMGPTRLTISKPVIAAVTGYAVAGGLQLACWCDMIVSHPQVVFGVFCRRFGVPLIDGGTIRLSKIIGLNRARDMILTGRAVKGKQAFDWGLVNRLTEKQKVLQKSIQLAKQIIIHPRLAMLGDRRSLLEATFPTLERDLYNEYRIGLESIAKQTKVGAKKFKEEKQGRGGVFAKL